jgi:hypothetical protein
MKFSSHSLLPHSKCSTTIFDSWIPY